MIITNIAIKNFLGIGEINIDLSKYTGITLIEGVNHDSPTSISNGASKSSLMESVYYCLYGKTKRGYSGDEVVNTFAKKDCSVVVDFEIGEKKYKISRYRKHSEFGNHLGLVEVSEDGMISLSAGTAKDTQKNIEDLIGMSDLTFSKILYFGQEDIKSFAGLSDAELKAVFEESLALTVLSDTELIFKNEVNAVSGKLFIVSRELERLKIEEKSSADIVETIKCSIGSYEEMRNKNLDSILGAISLTKKDHDDYVSNADKRRVDLQSKVYDFDDKSEKYIQISDLDSQLDFELKKNNSNQTSIGNEINSLKRNILVLESKIKSASELIGKPCETCSRPYRAEDIDPTVAIYKSNKDKAECDLETLILMLSGAVAKEKSLSESKLKIKEALSSLLKMKHEAEIANSELLKMDDEEVIGSFMNRIEEYQAQYHRVQTTINPYIKQFETSLASLSEIRENIDASLKQLEELTCMVDDLKLLQSAFGNSGIKNRVFDTITPELNKIISEYMAIVDDINVEVSTMKILKSGSIREKFEIVVENTHGASSYKGNSGGEKQKIDLCISLAFNSLMRRMIKNPINILFLDEPFEALDAGSAEAAVELCGLVAKDTNVFIVTHNQAIKDMVSNRIVVEKKSGLAKLLEE